jgi:uncharacterized glyoxalase superfamily protein PhnB
MTWGDTIVMPAQRTEESIWTPGPVSIFLTIENPDALYEKVQKAGLEIVQTIRDQEYGSREFAFKDDSDNIWIFGTYQAGQ